MHSQFSCSAVASLAGLLPNTPFCRQGLTERRRKGLLQTVQTTTISPESNRKERFCSGSFLRQGRARACAWVRGAAAAAASFASAIRISEGEEETASSRPSSLLPPPALPLRLDNRNGKVKTNFDGEGMQECGK